MITDFFKAHGWLFRKGAPFKRAESSDSRQRRTDKAQRMRDPKLSDLAKSVSELKSIIYGLQQQINNIETATEQAPTRTWVEERVRALQISSTFLPDPWFEMVPADSPFMQYSTCNALDFFHPRYKELCTLFEERPQFHRKRWEWVFIIHHLREAGVLKPGSRGVGFGVGREPLPAVFASFGASVVATDAPQELPNVSAWSATNQYSSSLDQLRNVSIIRNDLFDQRVSYRSCDMNNLDPELTGFDFNWSSCCFEHLGSIKAGIEFIINCVEKTLKIGGIACHTTELNLSSNEQTVDNCGTVLYRRRDIDSLREQLVKRGHTVSPFTVAPNSHCLDFHVDVPPYMAHPHLKLALGGYTSTSVGVVVKRGR